MRCLLLLLALMASSHDNDLWSLLQSNQYARAKALLAKGTIYIDAKENGSSALHHAVWEGNIPAARFLLAQGADPDDPDANSNTPLMLASSHGELAMVQLLVSSGARLDLVSHSNQTPLMLAIEAGADSVVAYLLTKVEDPFFEPRLDHDHFRSGSALFQAIVSRDTTLFERLYAQSPDPNRRLRDGRSLLMVASRLGAARVFRKLLALNADVSARDSEGNSALHHACETGADSSILEQLLERGADPNLRNDLGRTPLHLAVISRSLADVRVLLRRKIEVDSPDREGRTAIYEAMSGGLVEVALLLKERGANPLLPSLHHSQSSLLVPYESPGIMKLLLASGADPNARIYSSGHSGEERYQRILTVAGSRGWPDVVDLAIGRGADPSLTDDAGMDPLQCALENRQYGALQRLLIGGGTIDPLSAGQALRGLVATDDSLNVISVLLRSGANVDDRDEEGRTPLMIAAGKCQTMNLKVLLKAKAHQSLRDEAGRSALHHALAQGCGEGVRILMGKDAPVKDGFPEDQSLPYLALAGGDTSLANALLSRGAAAVLPENGYESVFGPDGSGAVARFVLRRFGKLDVSRALLAAAGTRDADLVRLLIRKKAEVNFRGRDGRTPLMVNCDYAGNYEVRKILEANGADWGLRDHSGKTARFYCDISEGD